MKTKTILFTSLLVVSLILSACGSKDPTDTTVNLPAISGEAGNTALPPASETQAPADAYPVEQPADVSALEAAITYPVEDSSPTYDADMRAYIEQILGGTMPIEDLFGKDDDVTREILQNAAQGRIIVSETGLDKAADWLEKQ